MPDIHAILTDPKTKRAYNKRLFAIVAPRYDAATSLLSLGRDSVWKTDLCRRIPSVTDATILDIATGNGCIARLLRKRYASAVIAACDLSAPMLALASVRSRTERVELNRQDMSSLGIKNNSIDIITGGYALRNAPDLAHTLKELRRVIKPGGTAHFLEFTRPSNRVLSRIQYALLWLWGSIWGLLLHADPSVYAYIARSLRAYPDRKTLHEMMRRAGFTIIDSRLRMAGNIELLAVRAV